LYRRRSLSDQSIDGKVITPATRVHPQSFSASPLAHVLAKQRAFLDPGMTIKQFWMSVLFVKVNQQPMKVPMFGEFKVRRFTP
jgi:hypothetical protein